jgi:orotate phosphoribosyltransferase
LTLSSPESLRLRLLELLSTLSVRRGTTTLASGRTSDFYVDCKQTALHSEGASLIGQLLFAHVQQLRQQGHRIDGIGGLSLGADPLAVACATVSFALGAPVHAFIIRKQAKAHGTRAFLEGGNNLPQGSSVLIVEDVVTSGSSAQTAVERALESGLKPCALVSLVDRLEGGAERLAALNLPVASLFVRTDFI